jgi:acetyltransferase-like isoleucine patch superfamily enzyme
MFSKLLKPEMIGYNFWNNKKIVNTRISNHSHISNHKNLEIGSNVFIFHNVYIDGYSKITLCDGVAIGHCCTLATHSAHLSLRLYGDQYSQTPKSELKGLLTGEIYIGSYSFIGPNSVIMPNTRIGKGSIVSAFSYVSGDFPDYSIIKGNPAVVVGNSKKLDEQLLNRYPELKNTYFDQDSISVE